MEGTVSQIIYLGLKPVLHCDANHLRWVLALAWTPNVNFKICVTQRKTPTQDQWNILRVGHADLRLFFCVGDINSTQCKSSR